MLFSGQAVYNRPRPAPVSASMTAHALVLVFLMLRADFPPPRKNAYQQSIAGKESKLLWYRFKDKLPAVKPLQRRADNRPPKAEVKLAQTIISSPPQAPKARQMVYQPAPDLKFTPELKSANVLAAVLKDVPRPVRRLFTPPELQRAQLPRLQELAPAPELRAAVKMPEDFRFSKAYRHFVPPTMVRAVPRTLQPPLPTAPELAPAATAAVAGLPSKFSGARRPFTAPPSAAHGTAQGRTPQGLPPEPLLAGTPNTFSGAIVGLDPSEKIAIPNASRPAQFSGGPVVRPDGGVPGSSKDAVAVPDLYVSGGKPDPHPVVVARNTLPRFPSSVTSDEALHAAGRYLTVKDIGHASGTRVANPPDPRFEGRNVYTMAVQMPNITSYVGSWLMWYSERESTLYKEDAVSAPMPVHKVDPKYIATAAEERVEGTVRVICVLDAAGRVNHVELLRGIDERLDRAAMEAFAKWEFTPATRKGTPVAVDLLVEIPFRLAPRARK